MNKQLPYALHDINGNEIVKFINEQIRLNNSEGDYDTAITGEIEFESQEVMEHTYLKTVKSKAVTELTYHITFHCYWNNWGADTLCHGSIRIYRDGSVVANFDEPLCDDGTADLFEETLKEWLPTHEFSQHNQEMYTNLMQDIQDDMVLIYTPDAKTTPEIIDGIIEKLKTAKSYIK